MNIQPAPFTVGLHSSEGKRDSALVIDATGHGVCQIWALEHVRTIEQTDATATLFAAAPKLLAALDGLFEHCAMVHKHWGDNSNAREAAAAIEHARATIAQAKGETS